MNAPKSASPTDSQISAVMRTLRARLPGHKCARTREQAQHAAFVRWANVRAKQAIQSTQQKTINH